MMAHLTSRQLTIIGMGALSSLLFSFLFSRYLVGAFLFQFAQIPLFYALLRYGTKAALGSAALATLFIFIVLPPVGILYFLMIALPCVFLGKEALKALPHQRSLNELVTIAVLSGLLLMTCLFGLTELVLSSDASKPLFDDMSKVSFQIYGLAFSFDHLSMLMKAAPGFILITMLMMTYFSGALVHTLLDKKNLSLRKIPFSIETLTLDSWLWFLWGAGLLGVGLGQETFIRVYSFNVLLVLILPFLLQGLSIMHVFCHSRPQGRGLLWTFYVFMVMCFWIVPFMVLLGIFEPWLQLRRRIEEQTRRRK